MNFEKKLVKENSLPLKGREDDCSFVENPTQTAALQHTQKTPSKEEENVASPDERVSKNIEKWLLILGGAAKYSSSILMYMVHVAHTTT